MPTIDIFPNDVSRTLLIPLWARATPCCCNPRCAYDPQAVRLFHVLRHECAAIGKAFGKYGQVACLARDFFMDEAIRGFVAAHPAGTIVDMGCGLGTAGFRSYLAAARWYDVDTPAVIRLRQRLLPALRHQHWIAAALEDPAWLDAITVEPGAGTLFMAAGVFQYLRPDAVRKLLICMAERFPGGRLCLDAASPVGLLGANLFVRRTGNTGAPMYFALRSPRDLEGWSPRLRLAHARPLFAAMPRKGLSLWTRTAMACLDALGLGHCLTVDFAA